MAGRKRSAGRLKNGAPGLLKLLPAGPGVDGRLRRVGDPATLSPVVQLAIQGRYAHGWYPHEHRQCEPVVSRSYRSQESQAGCRRLKATEEGPSPYCM
jgi:hypothetical protein